MTMAPASCASSVSSASRCEGAVNIEKPLRHRCCDSPSTKCYGNRSTARDGHFGPDAATHEEQVPMRLSPALPVLSFVRRAVLALAFLLPVMATAQAATPAEALIADNIHTGLDILNNKQLAQAQRA